MAGAQLLIQAHSTLQSLITASASDRELKLVILALLGGLYLAARLDFMMPRAAYPYGFLPPPQPDFDQRQYYMGQQQLFWPEIHRYDVLLQPYGVVLQPCEAQLRKDELVTLCAREVDKIPWDNFKTTKQYDSFFDDPAQVGAHGTATMQNEHPHETPLRPKAGPDSEFTAAAQATQPLCPSLTSPQANSTTQPASALVAHASAVTFLGVDLGGASVLILLIMSAEDIGHWERVFLLFAALVNIGAAAATLPFVCRFFGDMNYDVPIRWLVGTAGISFASVIIYLLFVVIGFRRIWPNKEAMQSQCAAFYTKRTVNRTEYPTLNPPKRFLCFDTEQQKLCPLASPEEIVTHRAEPRFIQISVRSLWNTMWRKPGADQHKKAEQNADAGQNADATSRKAMRYFLWDYLQGTGKLYANLDGVLAEQLPPTATAKLFDQVHYEHRLSPLRSVTGSPGTQLGQTSSEGVNANPDRVRPHVEKGANDAGPDAD